MEKLINALDEKDPGVRWVIGEALIALRHRAVRPLLLALTKSELPNEFLQGAHHVLHHLSQFEDLTPPLQPVVAALEQPEPALAAPLAAMEALKDLKT